MTDTLKDRVALVTGGSRGIGRAISLSLASEGAAVAVNYRKRESEAADVVGEIERAGGRAIAVRADVSVNDEVEAMIAEVSTRLGMIDVLVNNAGMASIVDIDTITEAQFDRMLAVNLKSAFLCTQSVLRGMRQRRWGRIINMSSLAARGAGIVGVHYNASKAGLEGLTRGYSARLAADGITVNAVAPGPVDTEMAEPLKAANVAARIPLGRFATPEEVAQVVMLLVRDGYITGQTIPVNGGLSFI
jgi:3-oxoacyl-[acyl-carrier protein] reductase